MGQSPFSPDELERYARHLVLPEIGGAGQQKLKTAHVLMVGAGGLGSPALAYLAAAGVGRITLVDDDVVSLSNLQRQTIHDTDSVGQPKVKSAAQSLARINPHVVVKTVAERVTPANISLLLKGKTVALDGTDNFTTRYLMADSCAAAHVPLVTAALSRFDGSLTTLMPWVDNNPAYRDLFPTQPDDDMLPTCAQAGIMGAVAGVLGTLQALETIKVITGAGELLTGRLLLVDGLSMNFSTMRYGRAKL